MLIFGMSLTEYEIEVKTQLEEIIVRVTAIYKSHGKNDPDGMAEQWLHLENYNFGRVTPIRMVECGRGHKVLQFIKAIEQGY